MIDKRGNGFGAYEMLVVCVIILIVMVVILAYVFKTNYNEKYEVMQYNARMFGLSVANYSLIHKEKDVYYLQEMTDKKVFSNIKNPFQGTKYCDRFESKVELRNDRKYVTLKCGNYLISNVDFVLKNYKIYQVSEWSNRRHNKDDYTREFYNYSIDDKQVFPFYMEKDYFLYEYNKRNKTAYNSIKKIPKDVIVNKKIMYRHMKRVN